MRSWDGSLQQGLEIHFVAGVDTATLPESRRPEQRAAQVKAARLRQQLNRVARQVLIQIAVPVSPPTVADFVFPSRRRRRLARRLDEQAAQPLGAGKLDASIETEPPISD